MAMQYNYGIIHWLDDNGKPAQSFVTTQDQDPGRETALLPLCAAAQNCCDAAIVAVQMVTTTLISGVPSTGPFKTVFDRAVLLNRITGTNRPARQALVGPSDLIFLPGNRLVDLTNSDVIAYQNEVVAVLGDSAGHPAGPFIRGVRQVAGGS